MGECVIQTWRNKYYLRKRSVNVILTECDTPDSRSATWYDRPRGEGDMMTWWHGVGRCVWIDITCHTTHWETITCMTLSRYSEARQRRNVVVIRSEGGAADFNFSWICFDGHWPGDLPLFYSELSDDNLRNWQVIKTMWCVKCSVYAYCIDLA